MLPQNRIKRVQKRFCGSNPAPGEQGGLGAGFVSLAHVFSVPDWYRSQTAPDIDPGGEVLAWEFTPLPQARERLQALPWPAMREPILAHLDGAGERFYSYAVADPAGDPTSASRV